MRKYLIALAAATIASSAYAVDMEIVKKIDVPVSEAASKIEIQGIKPGMKAADAWEIFSKAYPSDAPEIQKFSITVHTNEVTSQPFEIAYDNNPGLNRDQLQVFLASPSVGGDVYGANRKIYYPAEKGYPQASAVLEQLEQKYGKPSKVEKDEYNEGISAFWYVGGTGECGTSDVCDRVFNPRQIHSYVPKHFGHYINEMSFGPEVVVAARIQHTIEKNGKAFSLDLSFLDLKRRGLSAESDTEQVKAAQKALEEKPAALPEL